MLEWLFLYQRARMRTYGDENSSRKKILVDLPTEIKEVEDETELWETREHHTAVGTLSGRMLVQEWLLVICFVL